ncbi:MAG TPA: energy transducer TonB [Pyrinomonadaceae bacterium]|nr:energy transducer TonB [Pyrinomonadaceae bacterium]
MSKKIIWIIVCLLGFCGLNLAQGNLKEIKVVSQGVLNGKAVYLPIPVYSKAAIAVNASGTVGVLVAIDEEGNVVNAVAKSGHLLLRLESVKAAMKSKFVTTMLSGKPTSVTGIIQYNYISYFPPQKYQNEYQSKKEIVVGKPIKLLRPPFPQCNCKFSNNYITVVQFIVNESGNVESAKAMTGHIALKQASEVAVRNSKFSISKVNGEPVKAIGIITYDFVKTKTWFKSKIVDWKLRVEENGKNNKRGIQN